MGRQRQLRMRNVLPRTFQYKLFVAVVNRQPLERARMEEVDLVSNLADPGLVAALRRQLAACGIERDEALAQQAASAEILQVINRSPGDLTSVFDVILEKATLIGEAKFGIAYRFDGNVFRVEAVRDATPAFIEYLRREPPRPDPKNALGRLIQTRQPIHITDIK